MRVDDRTGMGLSKRETEVMDLIATGQIRPSLSAADLVRVFLARPDLERAGRGERADHKSVFREKNLSETVAWDSVPEPTEWKREISGRPAIAALFEEYEAKSGQHYPSRIRLVGTGPDGKESSSGGNSATDPYPLAQPQPPASAGNRRQRADATIVAGHGSDAVRGAVQSTRDARGTAAAQ